MNLTDIFKNKKNSDFNTSEKTQEFMLNSLLKDKEGPLSKLYEFIDVACNDVGAEIYEKIINYKQNLIDIDYCGLHELYNISKQLDVENIFSYDFKYPKKIGELIDLLSISKTRLFQNSDILTEDLRKSLYSFNYDNSFVDLTYLSGVIVATVQRSTESIREFPEFAKHFENNIELNVFGYINEISGNYEISWEYEGDVLSGDFNTSHINDIVFDDLWYETGFDEDTFGNKDGEMYLSADVGLIPEYVESISGKLIERYENIEYMSTVNYIKYIEKSIHDLMTAIIQPEYIDFKSEESYLRFYISKLDQTSPTYNDIVILIEDYIDNPTNENTLAVQPHLINYTPGNVVSNQDEIDQYYAFMSDIFNITGKSKYEIIDAVSIILRNICVRTSYYRETLKFIMQKHSEVGSRNAIIHILEEYILRSFTKREDWLQGTDFEKIGELSGNLLDELLTNIIDIGQEFQINVEEYYDTTEYLNINKTDDISGDGNLKYWYDFNEAPPISANLSGEFETWNPLNNAFILDNGISADISNGYDIEPLTSDIYDFHQHLKKVAYNNILESEHSADEVYNFYDQLGLPGRLSGDWDSNDIYDNAPKLDFLTKIYDTYTPQNITGDLFEFYDFDNKQFEIVSLDDLYSKYLNTNTGFDPAVNFKNQNFASIASQPYIWNLVKKIEKRGFQNIDVMQLPSDDDRTVDEERDIYGNLINATYSNLNPILSGEYIPSKSWMSHNNEFICYKSNFEHSHNLKYNYEPSIMIDFDGPFKPASLSKYLEILEYCKIGTSNEFSEDMFKFELLEGMKDEYKNLTRFFDLSQTRNGVNILNQLYEFRNEIIELKNKQIVKFVTDSSGNSYILYKDNKLNYDETGIVWMRYRNHPLSFPLSSKNWHKIDDATAYNTGQVYLRDSGSILQELANNCYDIGIAEDSFYILGNTNKKDENNENIIETVYLYDDFGNPIYLSDVDGNIVTPNVHLTEDRTDKTTFIYVFQFGYESINSLSLTEDVFSLIYDQNIKPARVELTGKIASFVGVYFKDEHMIFTYIQNFNNTNDTYNVNLNFSRYNLLKLEFEEVESKYITDLPQNRLNNFQKIWHLAKGENLLSISYECILQNESTTYSGIVTIDLNVHSLRTDDIQIMEWNNFLNSIRNVCYRTYIFGGAGDEDYSLSNNMYYLNTWYVRTPLLNTPRGYVSCANFERYQKCIILGGFGVDENEESTQLDTIDMYSPDEDRFVHVSKHLSKQKDSMTTASVDLNIWMFGGGSESTNIHEELSEIESFNFVTTSISTCVMTQARRNACSEHIKAKESIFIMGGENSNITEDANRALITLSADLDVGIEFYDITEKFDYQTETIHSVTANEKISASSSFKITETKTDDNPGQEFIFKMGGYVGTDEDNIIDTMHMFDHSNNTYIEKQPLTYKRSFAAGTDQVVSNIENTKLSNMGYIIGGVNYGTPHATCQEYSKYTDTWLEKLPMVDNRETHGATTIKKASETLNNVRAESYNSMFLFGGALEDYLSTTVENNDFTWTNKMPMPIKIGCASAQSFDIDNYIIGGYNNESTQSQTNLQYNSLFNNWIANRSLVIPLESHATTNNIKMQYSSTEDLSTTYKHESIFTFNGIQSETQSNNNVLEYKVEVRSWETKREFPLQNATQNSIAVTLFDNIAEHVDNSSEHHIIGGSNFDMSNEFDKTKMLEIKMSHQKYNNLTDTFSENVISGLPEVSAGSGIKINNDEFIIAGGFNQGFSSIYHDPFLTPLSETSGLNSTTNLYNKNTNTWTDLSKPLIVNSIYGGGCWFNESATIVGGVKDRDGASSFLQNMDMDTYTWRISDVMPLGNRSFALTVNKIDLPPGSGLRFKSYEYIASNGIKSWVAELLPIGYKNLGKKYKKFLNTNIWYAGQRGCVGDTRAIETDQTLYNGSFFERIFRNDGGDPIGVESPNTRILNGVQFNDDCFYLSDKTYVKPKFSILKHPSEHENDWVIENNDIITYNTNDVDELKEYENTLIASHITKIESGAWNMLPQFNYILETDLQQPLVLDNNVITFIPGINVDNEIKFLDKPLNEIVGQCNYVNPYNINAQTQLIKNMYNSDYETELIVNNLSGIRSYQNIGRNRGTFWMSYNIVKDNNVAEYEFVELINTFYKLNPSYIGSNFGSGLHKSNIFSIEIKNSTLNEFFNKENENVSDEANAKRIEIKNELHNIIKDSILTIIRKLSPASTQLWKIEFTGS